MYGSAFGEDILNRLRKLKIEKVKIFGFVPEYKKVNIYKQNV